MWWASRRPAVQKQEVRKQQHDENGHGLRSRIQPNLPRYLRLILYAVMLIVIALAVEEVRRLIQEHFASKPVPVVKVLTLAVLPFRSSSTDVHATQFALGLTDDVIDDLGKAATLRIIGRASTRRFQNTPESPRDIARQLHADKIVLGTVTQSSGRIHASAELIDGSTGQLLWSRQFDQSDPDLLSAENNAADAIATAVETTLLPARSSAFERSNTSNSQVCVDYLTAPPVRRLWKSRVSPKPQRWPFRMSA